MDKNVLHYVSVTGIIRKDGKYLLCKRSEKESVLPGKWCVPGGKVEVSDYSTQPKDTSMHWLMIFEKVLAKEVREETALEIDNVRYVSSLAFTRPNGFSSLVISMCADWKSGGVVLANDELVEYVWATLAQAKNYDLIENIYEQLEVVERMYAKSN